METKLKTGDIVKFGRYPQVPFGEPVPSEFRESDTTPLEWRVLELQGDRALLLTEKAIDCKPYHEIKKRVTWEKCTLREWLNHEFMEKAFDSNERERIAAVKNTNFRWNGARATANKILLLSVKEAKRYFSSDEDRRAKPTQYAMKNNAYVNMNDFGTWWWLRSTVGLTGSSAVFVLNDGTIAKQGDYVDHLLAVRPALWLH